MRGNRIQKKSSKTAAYTCCMRAASFLEKNPYYHSDDYIAPMLLPPFVRLFINIIKNFLAPRGIYEYVIARTKYIDSIFKKAIDENYEQILIFGAGFDSRGIRYYNENNYIKVFELDAIYTQEAKFNELTKRGIKSPHDIIYIPIDFSKEKIEDKLEKFAFVKGKKSLFILEGLVMYLDRDAVENTFKIIGDYFGRDSLMVFDYVYASVLRKENTCYGENSIHRVILSASEPWRFGIERDGAEAFLVQRGFRLLEHLDSTALENRYFTDSSGKRVGRINGTHCLVLAGKL